MEKNRYSVQIEPSLCSDFIFTAIDSFGDPLQVRCFRKMRDVTILLNEQLTSQFDPIRLKQASTPHRPDDGAYQSLSDSQKFDAIKPRSIQQPADLELYNDILQQHANEIKESAQDVAERSRLLREISQTSKESVSAVSNQFSQTNKVTE